MAKSARRRFASDPVVMKSSSTWLLFYFGLASDRHARDLLVFSPDLAKFIKTNKILVDVEAKGTIDVECFRCPCNQQNPRRTIHDATEILST